MWLYVLAIMAALIFLLVGMLIGGVLVLLLDIRSGESSTGQPPCKPLENGEQSLTGKP